MREIPKSTTKKMESRMKANADVVEVYTYLKCVELPTTLAFMV